MWQALRMWFSSRLVQIGHDVFKTAHVITLIAVAVFGSGSALSACTATSASKAPQHALSTRTGTITEFQLPILHSLQYLVVGPDGNLWFTETIGNNVGRITPDGAITELAVPTGRPGGNTTSSPAWLVVGPDGNLWFGEGAGSKIGRVTITGVK